MRSIWMMKSAMCVGMGLALVLPVTGCRKAEEESSKPEPSEQQIKDAFREALEDAGTPPDAAKPGAPGLGPGLGGVTPPTKVLGVWPGDIPGMPTRPELTGDAKADKATILATLKDLQAAWTKNKEAHQALMKKNEKSSSPQLKEIEARNKAFQAAADHLQDLLDELRD